MLKKMLKNKKGFSLIELIVVIAILGVIAVIAVPSVMSTLKKSKIDSDVASARAIIHSIETAYNSLNNDADPDNNLSAIAQATLDGADETVAPLEPFIDLKKIPGSATGQHFYLTLNNTGANVDKPVITVKFYDGAKTHVVTQDGVDKPVDGDSAVNAPGAAAAATPAP